MSCRGRSEITCGLRPEVDVSYMSIWNLTAHRPHPCYRTHTQRPCFCCGAGSGSAQKCIEIKQTREESAKCVGLASHADSKRKGNNVINVFKCRFQHVRDRSERNTTTEYVEVCKGLIVEWRVRSTERTAERLERREKGGMKERSYIKRESRGREWFGPIRAGW